MRTGQHRAAAGGRLDQVLPAQRREAAPQQRHIRAGVIGRHLAHRVAQPDIGLPGQSARPGAGPAAAPHQRQAAGDHAGADLVEALRMTRHQQQQRPRLRGRTLRQHRTPGRQQRLVLAFAPARSQHHRPRQTGTPAQPGGQERRCRLQVVFQIAADLDRRLRRTRPAQPSGIVRRLGQHGGEGARRRSEQGIEAQGLAQAFLRQPRIGQHDRHAGLPRRMQQRRPDLGLHQHTQRRTMAPQETAGRARRVERQPAQGIALAQQRGASFAAGGSAVGQQQAQVRTDLAQGLDQRLGRTGLAQRDRMQPQRARPHRLAQADTLGQRGAVERLLARAPQQPTDQQRQQQAHQLAIADQRQTLAQRQIRMRSRRVHGATCRQACSTCSSVGGSPAAAPSTLSWWRWPCSGCGPVRQEVGKL